MAGFVDEGMCEMLVVTTIQLPNGTTEDDLINGLTS